MKKTIAKWVLFGKYLFASGADAGELFSACENSPLCSACKAGFWVLAGMAASMAIFATAA